MNSQFWKLQSRNPDSTRGDAEWDGDAIRKLEKVYGEVNLFRRYGRAPGVDVNLPVLLTSRRFKDFIWTLIGYCLIQDRVLRMFEEEGFTGLEARPVDARMKVRRHWDPVHNYDPHPGVSKKEAGQVEIPKLWELIASGWGGVAREESGMCVVRIRDDGSPQYSAFTDASKLINESQWDGSDFFRTWPLGRYVLVTDRVARFIKRNKLTGVGLVRVEDMSMDPDNPVVPGYLRNWLPEEKARAIGEPLGIY